MDPETRQGGCRCGRVRFAVTGAALVTMACHCDGCRRMTASAYSVSGLYPGAAFRITQGKTVLGGLKGDLQHHFCGFCLSWLFTAGPMLVDMVNVRITLLDDPMTEPPFIECWTETALPWAQTGASRRFPRFPDPAEFPALVAAYAGRQAP
ncbi:GFA family protein [Paracoccus shandongensis]|uniref:GFA family protein n=1 Tax=Paracoccus shandongensis TaxID=2816048 RepID=UPI001A8E33A7|nr:GFA family protein [Paracoccus shandongensis]